MRKSKLWAILGNVLLLLLGWIFWWGLSDETPITPYLRLPLILYAGGAFVVFVGVLVASLWKGERRTMTVAILLCIAASVMAFAAAVSNWLPLWIISCVWFAQMMGTLHLAVSVEELRRDHLELTRRKPTR